MLEETRSYSCILIGFGGHDTDLKKRRVVNKYPKGNGTG